MSVSIRAIRCSQQLFITTDFTDAQRITARAAALSTRRTVPRSKHGIAVCDPDTPPRGRCRSRARPAFEGAQCPYRRGCSLLVARSGMSVSTIPQPSLICSWKLPPGLAARRSESLSKSSRCRFSGHGFDCGLNFGKRSHEKELSIGGDQRASRPPLGQPTGFGMLGLPGQRHTCNS